jgi:hypothetical protein
MADRRRQSKPVHDSPESNTTQVSRSENLESSVPRLRGTPFNELAAQVEQLRGAAQKTPIVDLRDDTRVSPTNGRVRRALRDSDEDEATLESQRALLPPMPDPVTEESACDWLRQVIPMMDPRLRYTKSLVRVVQEFDYKKSKAKADK